jgi:hypothetical protein
MKWQRITIVVLALALLGSLYGNLYQVQHASRLTGVIVMASNVVNEYKKLMREYHSTALDACQLATIKGIRACNILAKLPLPDDKTGSLR